MIIGEIIDKFIIRDDIYSYHVIHKWLSSFIFVRLVNEGNNFMVLLKKYRLKMNEKKKNAILM